MFSLSHIWDNGWEVPPTYLRRSCNPAAPDPILVVSGIGVPVLVSDRNVILGCTESIRFLGGSAEETTTVPWLWHHRLHNPVQGCDVNAWTRYLILEIRLRPPKPRRLSTVMIGAPRVHVSMYFNHSSFVALWVAPVLRCDKSHGWMELTQMTESSRNH
jgi:hypothetical protein